MCTAKVGITTKARKLQEHFLERAISCAAA
jgi:hypothetical protein